MIDKLLQLTLGLSFIFIMCFGCYKITTFITHKLVDLVFRSWKFAFISILMIAIFFIIIGSIMLYERINDLEPDSLTLYFPFLFGVAGVLIYIVFLIYEKRRTWPVQLT